MPSQNSIPSGRRLDPALARRREALRLLADRAAVAPLGTIGKFVYAGSADGAVKRLERWALQSVAREILRKSQQWRGLCNCCRAVQAGRGVVDVYRAVEGAGRAFYGGLQHCGSVWVCAVCAAKIVEYRRGELGRGLEALRSGGGSAALLTLTFSHGPQHGFVDLDKRLASALRHFHNSRAWRSLKGLGLMGTIRAYEVTWGPLNGWHPHIHMLLMFGSAALPEGLQALLWGAWAAALALVKLTGTEDHACLVQSTYGAVADYVAKWGVEPVSRPWGTEDELARGVVKSARSGARFTPPDLLRLFRETGEAEYRDRFREYAAGTRGRSQLRWSPGLRLLLGLGDEIDDAGVVAGLEDGAWLGELTLSQWRVVLGADRRGELLEVASRGDWDAVLDYVKFIVKVAV